MSISTTNRDTWSLTLLRDGKDAQTNEIELAKFRYGRHSEELEGSSPLIIPDALITLLRHSEIESEAVESGFIVEMSTVKMTHFDWAPFTLVTNSTFSFSGEWGFRRPRGLYVGRFHGCSFENVNCSSPCNPKSLPETIWIRVDELPIHTVAWAVNNSIFEEESPRQMTLLPWTSEIISTEPRFCRNELALPGPSDKIHHFLS